MPNLPPRRRTGRPSWTQPIVERLTPTVKAFVVTSTVVYFFYVLVPAARPFMDAHLAVGPGLFRGEVWQPLTSLFFPGDVLGFIFNTIGIWFMGPLLERVQGTRQAVALFLSAGILSNLAQAGVAQSSGGMMTTGSSHALLALFVAYGRIFGRTETPVLGGLYLQARTFAIVFVVLGVLSAVFARSLPLLAGVLTAAAIGYAGGKPGGFAETWQAFKARSVRRRYRVIEGGGGRPKKKYLN
jgi:membrane associated rhomboid family serine protease